MGVRKNAFEKREEELAKVLLSTTLPEAEKNDVIKDNAEVKTSSEEIAASTEVIESKTESIIKVKEDTKIIEEHKLSPSNKNENILVLKKKTKDKRRQKNLWLKEDNIELLEKTAYQTDYNEGELIDLLIENYLKHIKIK